MEIVGDFSTSDLPGMTLKTRYPELFDVVPHAHNARNYFVAILSNNYCQIKELVHF